MMGKFILLMDNQTMDQADMEQVLVVNKITENKKNKIFQGKIKFSMITIGIDLS